jgi:hypothetical protein
MADGCYPRTLSGKGLHIFVLLRTSVVITQYYYVMVNSEELTQNTRTCRYSLGLVINRHRLHRARLTYTVLLERNGH